jgi:hypothetical protein
VTLLKICDVLPGLQEAAVDKFERVLDGYSNNVQNENVSKMFANGNPEGDFSGISWDTFTFFDPASLCWIRKAN